MGDFKQLLGMSKQLRHDKEYLPILNNVNVQGIAAFQPAHVARTMLYERYYDVKTLKRRPYNVALTSCVGWLAIPFILEHKGEIQRNKTKRKIQMKSNS